MTTLEASSSSSSSSKLWKYDVFVSFRGVDTGNLHAALKDRGYEVFMGSLESGEETKEELFRAIEESRISIIVFSKRYADSRWCLSELVKIMECRDKLGRKVYPIFYDVVPSDVRKQKGCLAQAFQRHEIGISEENDDREREAKKERVKQWREALSQAANLAGWHLQNTQNVELTGDYKRPTKDLLNQVEIAILKSRKDPKANSAEWIFLVGSLSLEILSAACDQVSSPSRPRYALFGMLLAIAALLTCIWELIYKGRTQNVVWRRRGCYMLFGSAIESYGLVGGIAQCVCSIIQYVYYIRRADTPIKLSLLPAIFLICLITARLSRKRTQTTDDHTA